VPRSMVSQWPDSRIGCAQFPTRASASDQARSRGPATGRRPAGRCPRSACELERGTRGVAGQAVGEQRGQGVGDRLTGPGAHRFHHPRGCATRPRLRSRRATHPSREDRDHWLVKQCLDQGPLQRRDTTNQGPSRTSISMSGCFMRRSVYGLWPGGEPTPGEYPIHLVYVVFRSNHAATAPRPNSGRRAERAFDSLISR